VKLPAAIGLAAALALGAAAGRGAEGPPDGPLPALGGPPPPGAVPLWNGRDLAGWRFVVRGPPVDPSTLWTASDGILRLRGRPLGYARTLRSYGDFHLHVEWRWPVDAPRRTNSGVFVLVHGADAVWPPGIECQLAAGQAGQLVGTGVGLPGAPVIRAKPRAAPLRPSSEKPFGRWNAYDIYCRGRTVEVWVNGVLQNRVSGVTFEPGGGTAEPGLRGAIGLQAEGYPVEFRDLWLRPLPPPGAP
jgi:3-keto-disaccharide hydrolase